MVQRAEGLRLCSDTHGEDLFVHHSEVKGDPSSLASNDEVEYEVGEGKRGPIARALKLSEQPQAAF